jgi:hypothetical protein
MCFHVKQNLLMRLSLASLKGCYRLFSRIFDKKAGLFHYHGLVGLYAEPFVPVGPAFFVAGVDLTGELSDRQRMFPWHDDYSVTIGDDQVAGKNKDAGTIYGKIVRLGDEPSGPDLACAVSVFTVNRYFFDFDDLVGVAGAAVCHDS